MLLFSLLKQALINKKTLRFSKEQIKKLQRKKFLTLVQYAAEHSRYYQNIITQNNIDITNCRPEDFPLLTKEKLIDHFDEIVTNKQITKEKISKFLQTSKDSNDLFLNKYYVIHTSGSSGTIGYYVYSQKELAQGIAYSTRVNGIKLFQKIAFIAATKGHFAGITMLNAARKLPILYTDVQAFDINSPFATIIEKLNGMQPTILSGYAFALKKLADAQLHGKLHIKPILLQSGGEPLSTQDKIYIQKTFAAPVANIYASSEHLFMGIGRDSFNGMYLMEDNLYFEFQANGIRVTNLFNYTLPLIRYQMSDQLEPMNDISPKMPFTKVKEIVGRNEYVPIFINDKNEEDFISPILLVEFFVKNLTQFQFHLIDKNHFIFKACIDTGIKEQEREETVKIIKNKLHGILKEKLMNNVKFEIQIVKHLWADPKTGKFRLITKA